MNTRSTSPHCFCRPHITPSSIKFVKTSFPEKLVSVCLPKQRHTTQHNTTQHSTAQHNTTQHNTTQHNTTQHIAEDCNLHVRRLLFVRVLE